MLSPKNFFNHTIYKIISVAFTALFSVYSVTGGILKVPEKAPDDFTPVIRFAACSDIHLDGKEDQVNAERFAEMFIDTYLLLSSERLLLPNILFIIGDSNLESFSARPHFSRIEKSPSQIA